MANLKKLLVLTHGMIVGAGGDDFTDLCLNFNKGNINPIPDLGGRRIFTLLTAFLMPRGKPFDPSPLVMYNSSERPDYPRSFYQVVNCEC